MHELMRRLGWVAAGALAAYYLDPDTGARRRQRFMDLLPGRTPASSSAQRRRRAYHHLALSDPQSDARLRDAVARRLGRLVSHPGALHVEVDNGIVRLSGEVLLQERDGLLEQVREMPGVQKLINATTALERPDDLRGRAVPMESQLAD